VTPTLRRLLAAGAALLAVLAAAPEVVVHSHQAWETELARAITVRSAAPVPCAPAHHFDPAELDSHPPCPGCILSRAGLGALAPPAAPPIARTSAAFLLPPEPETEVAAPLRLAPGRAPPLA